MFKPMNFKELIELCSAQVDKIFRHTGQLLPMYHAITRNGEELIIPAPDVSKDLSVMLVKAELELRGVDTVVFFSEAWMLDSTKTQELDIESWANRGLAEHPDRREIIAFAAENRRGEMQTAKRYILRPEHGKAKLAPLQFDDMTGVQSLGRMVGLLTREK